MATPAIRSVVNLSERVIITENKVVQRGMFHPWVFVSGTLRDGDISPIWCDIGIFHHPLVSTCCVCRLYIRVEDVSQSSVVHPYRLDQFLVFVYCINIAPPSFFLKRRDNIVCKVLVGFPFLNGPQKACVDVLDQVYARRLCHDKNPVVSMAI